MYVRGHLPMYHLTTSGSGLASVALQTTLNFVTPGSGTSKVPEAGAVIVTSLGDSTLERTNYTT